MAQQLRADAISSINLTSQRCRSYTQIVAGTLHTVFIRSDGAAVACGAFGWPGPPVVLFRNDGTPMDVRYYRELVKAEQGEFVAWLTKPDFVVQLALRGATSADRVHAVCRNMFGDQLASWDVPDTSRQVKRCIEEVLQTGSRRLGVVLADGRLMSAQSTWRDILFREVYV